MNYEKYRNDGWGLSKPSFELIASSLEELKQSKDKITIVEFGSGISTQFFLDWATETNTEIELISFDNDKEHAYSKKDDRLTLHFTDLESCNDKAFRDMFKNKNYNPINFNIRRSPAHTRQKNTFYKIPQGGLPTSVDFVLLDGNHGNGRSIAFLHLVDRMAENSYIFIDDLSHYDFENRLLQIFDDAKVIKSETKLFKTADELWNNSINCGLYKI